MQSSCHRRSARGSTPPENEAVRTLIGTLAVSISAGVDVPSLFSRVGIEVGDTGERVGTFAIAYAAHKALSPVGFILP